MTAMEFWGVEVKAGEPVKVDPEEFDACIHLSQAALGEAKKDKASEAVVLNMKFGDQKIVLGTLSHEKFPQLSFDLVLEKEFELSHNWKNGSVYFCGYKAEVAGALDDVYESDDDDEDLPLMTKDNAKPDIKIEVDKAAASKSNEVKPGESKKQVKIVDPKKDDEDDENESSDEDMTDGDIDSDDESESDEDEDESPPKKADPAKKRPNDSASKTPVSAKKAKSATPQKTDNKKGGHTATPHPLKKGGKTPKSETKDQTPKSGGQFICKSCSKSFTSESGMQQHSKAKHGGQ